MHILAVSDLHNEYATWNPPVTLMDDHTVLVVAGDIGGLEKTIPWLTQMASRFLAVVAVRGNHDFWLGDFHAVQKESGVALGGVPNLHLLHRDEVVIVDPSTFERCRFVGATLWTHIPPEATAAVQHEMKDFNRITMDNYQRPICVHDLNIEHALDKSFFEHALQATLEYPTIAVSHHPPTQQSLDPRYKNHRNSQLLNYAYSNNMDYWAYERQFDAWLHGHVHVSNAIDYGNGVLRCNPRGYAPDKLNPTFNENPIPLTEFLQRHAPSNPIASPNS
jgi:Icc-related predicted phosphoesterase